ncbi:MAG: 4Fe-4S binding protein [Rhodospirillaceae bacterium]|nr:4Fe-4S binding protein [Rhodospirillaceae bacterium]
MKTASRLLGTALFKSGLEVQDAPRYGAERRGAPMVAFVRADRRAILERGAVVSPDLLLVADETLFQVPVAGVLAGLSPTTVLAIASSKSESIWRDRLKIDNPVYILPRDEIAADDTIPDVSALIAGAAARLLGLVSLETLSQAVEAEIAQFGPRAVEHNLQAARKGFEAMVTGEGSVIEGATLGTDHYDRPEWIDLDLDLAATAAPNVYAMANSVLVRTGLWRTLRPVLDPGSCGKCVWICGSACPDGVIGVNDDGYPEVDYDHCKGCMICVVQCPRHAFAATPEQEAAEAAQVAKVAKVKGTAS